MKGIILAGGSGTRLYPSTFAVSKQLMPLYDKPMIFYPLSTLMESGIRDITIITTPQDKSGYIHLLSNGSRFGININYVEQSNPNGIAEAFLLTEKIIGKSSVCLILGDNLFFGNQADDVFKEMFECSKVLNGSIGVTTKVKDPERYGVVEIDKDSNIISIEEKPVFPKSDLALTGIYYYDESVFEYVKHLKPSDRGELEITDLNQLYLNENRYNVKELGAGSSWLDTGTHESLLEASNFIKAIQARLGTLIACPEEIGLKKRWITKDVLLKEIEVYSKGPYYNYLKGL